MQGNSDGSTPMFEGGRLLAERYRLLEKIGEGGAAEVFRAKDQRLDRIVAIKLLRPQYIHDQASRTRFITEAKAAAGLSHPNIVDIYDFGEADDRSMFIAMQYVEGQNLKDLLLKRGRMSAAEVVSITQQVCHALSVAHAKDLIHRDVKPQNIMIDGTGNVRLTDFGIVKALTGPNLTQTGMTFGTAAYLSPEQATGAPISPASDIYSLGCVMYEMLAGMPPFSGENPAVVAYKQVWEQPRPLHELVPEVPPSLERVIMRCLNKEPQQRYAATDILAQELESLSTTFNQPTQSIAVGLGAMASLPGQSTEYTPLGAHTAAEQSRPIPMPRSVPSSAAAVPPVVANTPAPYLPVEPARAVPSHTGSRMQVVTAEPRKRRLGTVPIALLSVLLLGLCGLAAWQGQALFGGFAGSNGTPEPTATVTSAVAILEPSPTVGSVIVESPAVPSPEPLPTDTPLPPTPTPEPPPPTDTPAPPPPTDTPAPPPPTEPAPEPPTATPEPPLPPISTSGSVTIDGLDFAGGYTRSNGRYHNRTAKWVYGQGTQYNSMSTQFIIDTTPFGEGNLTIVGVDSEDPDKTPIRISVNGIVIFEGPTPLPNDDRSGPGGAGNWGTYTWIVPAGVLLPGANTVVITNTGPGSCINCPQFFMVDSMTVSW